MIGFFFSFLLESARVRKRRTGTKTAAAILRLALEEVFFSFFLSGSLCYILPSFPSHAQAILSLFSFFSLDYVTYNRERKIFPFLKPFFFLYKKREKRAGSNQIPLGGLRPPRKGAPSERWRKQYPSLHFFRLWFNKTAKKKNIREEKGPMES
jgi:hypothetical protein